MLITFAEGHSLNLPLRFAYTNQYGGLPAGARDGDGSDTYATYILNPDAIHEIAAGRISAIKVTTTAGLAGYAVNANRALKIQKEFEAVFKD